MSEAAHVEVIARGLAWNGNGRRLLVCEPSSGAYAYLPGGHVEFGEGAKAALRREMLEECGIDVLVGELAGVCESSFVQAGRRRHEWNLLFHMKHTLPEAVPSRESSIRFRWIEVEKVNEILFLPRVIGSAVARGLITPRAETLPIFLSDLAQPAG